jgi:hypothetical protein
MVQPCVVCGSNRTDLIGDFKTNRTEECDLSVTFFLKKFLKYQIIPDEFDPSTCGSDPTKTITFCWTCLPLIQEAQSLYRIISELEEKMDILRKRVERRVVASYRNDPTSTTVDKRRNVFSTVRSKIYQSRGKT